MTDKILVGSFALSPMQQGMLFHHLKEPHSGVDIEQIVIDLPEQVDPRRLESAWQWLLQRHDILRVQFAWEDAEPAQQEILSECLVPFMFIDSRHDSEPTRMERLKEFLEADRTRGFDLREAP